MKVETYKCPFRERAYDPWLLYANVSIELTVMLFDDVRLCGDEDVLRKKDGVGVVVFSCDGEVNQTIQGAGDCRAVAGGTV